MEASEVQDEPEGEGEKQPNENTADQEDSQPPDGTEEVNGECLVWTQLLLVQLTKF